MIKHIIYWPRLIKALSENKGRTSDFQSLDKLAERLNDESSNKGKLVDDY